MKFRVEFTLFNVRKSDIRSGYRPSWLNKTKLPNQSSGQLTFIGVPSINLGETYTCTLQPVVVELWNDVQVGDELKCMEGLKQVGKAIVLAIL